MWHFIFPDTFLLMANTKSALKRVRQTKTRTTRNRVVSSRMRTLRRSAIAAAEAGDKDGALKIFSQFTSAVDKAAKNNIVHKKTAANLKSRTNAALLRAQA